MAKGANWFVLVLLPLFLSPTEYGLVGLLAAVEMVGADILVLGQDRAILRFQPEEKRPGRLLFTSSTGLLGLNLLVIGGGFGGVLLLASHQVFSVPVVPHLLAIGAALVLLVQIRLQLASARSGERVGEFMAVRVSYAFGKLALVLALAAWLGDARAYALGVLGASMVTGGVAVLFLTQRWDPRFDRRLARRFLRFGSPLLLHVVAGGLLVFADRFMLERLASMAEVGVYTLAYTLGGAVAFVHLTAAIGVEPEVYRQASQRTARERILGAYTVGSLAVGSAVAAAILIFLPLLGGRAYEPIYGFLTILVPIILAAHLLQPLYMQGNWRLAAAGTTALLATSTALAAAANIALNWILIPHYGALGAAWATLVSYLFLAGMTVFSSLLWSGTPLNLLRERSYLAVAVLALCVVAFSEKLYLQLILLGGLAAAGAIRAKRLIAEAGTGEKDGAGREGVPATRRS